MNSGWDRELTGQLVRDHGLSWNQARAVVGVIAEQRQVADRDGYVRGYNDGFADGGERKCDRDKPLTDGFVKP